MGHAPMWIREWGTQREAKTDPPQRPLLEEAGRQSRCQWAPSD